MHITWTLEVWFAAHSVYLSECELWVVFTTFDELTFCQLSCMVSCIAHNVTAMLHVMHALRTIHFLHCSVHRIRLLSHKHDTTVGSPNCIDLVPSGNGRCLWMVMTRTASELRFFHTLNEQFTKVTVSTRINTQDCYWIFIGDVGRNSFCLFIKWPKMTLRWPLTRIPDHNW